MARESIIPLEGDVALHHPDVNSEVEYPFILYVKEDEKQKNLQQARGTKISIEVEIDISSGVPQMTKNIYLSILLMDTVTLTGTARVRAQDRARLLEIVNQGSGIAVITETQVLCGLVTEGHNMTFTEYRNFSIASMRFKKVDFNVIPPAPISFLNSFWTDEDNPAAGGSTWGDEDSLLHFGVWR